MIAQPSLPFFACDEQCMYMYFSKYSLFLSFLSFFFFSSRFSIQQIHLFARLIIQTLVIMYGNTDQLSRFCSVFGLRYSNSFWITSSYPYASVVPLKNQSSPSRVSHNDMPHHTLHTYAVSVCVRQSGRHERFRTTLPCRLHIFQSNLHFKSSLFYSYFSFFNIEISSLVIHSEASESCVNSSLFRTSLTPLTRYPVLTLPPDRSFPALVNAQSNSLSKTISQIIKTNIIS